MNQTFFIVFVFLLIMTSSNLIKRTNIWKEKPCGEYSSKEVEILCKAIHSTVNELAEMAGEEQGRSVKEFLIKLVDFYYNMITFIYKNFLINNYFERSGFD